MFTYKGLQRLRGHYRVAQLAIGEAIVRPKGWDAQGDEVYEDLSKSYSGFVYRGMTAAEYSNTVGMGKPIQSTLDYSFDSEGTSFAEDPGTAEGYVNFGRDDPRKTGVPNYLVEVEETETMYRDQDGYIKDKKPVSLDNVHAVWEFTSDEEGNLWMRRL